MKHVFYGGAFDPMTVAHERIIRGLYEDFGDRLVVGVTNHDYKTSWKPVEWRIECVGEFCNSLKWGGARGAMVVEQDCRTWDFLDSLGIDVGTIVVGMDEWDDLKARKWRHADELLSKYRFLVLPRNDGVSSTKVRQMLKDGLDETELLRYVGVRVWQRLLER